MLKNKKFYIMLIALVLVISMTACSNDQGKEKEPLDKSENTSSDEPIVLKLANGSAIGDERDQSLHEFAKLVDEKSNGSIKIEVYSGGTLGTWREVIEGLELGQVQIVNESIGTLEAYSPTAGIDAYPYLYRDVDHYTSVMSSEIGQELLNQVGDEGNFEIMGPSNRGARVMTSNKKVENASDLKGLKIRTPGIQMYIKTWEYLGASPTPMDPSEIYTGLQLGTVDAQENPVLYSYGNAYYDVTDYLVLTNHVFSTDVFIFDKEYFNNLSEEVQMILREAATEAGEFRTQLVLETEAETIKMFEEKGLEVVEPDIQSFMAKLTEFTQEFPHLEELVNKIQEYK